MRLRKTVLAGLGALGTAAVGNRALERRAGELEPPLDGSRRTYRWRGMDVAYTEAGDVGDPTVLFLHGINAAATSREFAGVFEALAEDYHVVAPDFPGFGLSDRPRIEYDADLYVDFTREFAADVTPGATCVASSLSGSYGALAQREAGVFSRLVLVCPTATTTAIRRPLVRRFFYLPVVGTAAFNLLGSRASIRYFDRKEAYYGPVEAETVAYQWRTAHQPGARYAPAAFVSGHLDPEAGLGGVLASIDVPVTLVWGREAGITPLSYGRDLAEAGDAKLVVFDRARLLPHVEHAERFHDVLAGELDTGRRPRSVD